MHGKYKLQEESIQTSLLSINIDKYENVIQTKQIPSSKNFMGLTLGLNQFCLNKNALVYEAKQTPRTKLFSLLLFNVSSTRVEQN